MCRKKVRLNQISQFGWVSHFLDTDTFNYILQKILEIKVVSSKAELC